MDRERKYRAWDKTNKIMVYVNFSCVQNICYSWFSKPMDYTGYKDKNDTEIYEGDVIKNSIDEYYLVKYGLCYCEGGYEYLGFYLWDFKWQEAEEGDYLSTKWTSYEIVGNVYKHSDLVREITIESKKNYEEVIRKLHEENSKKKLKTTIKWTDKKLDKLIKLCEKFAGYEFTQTNFDRIKTFILDTNNCNLEYRIGGQFGSGATLYRGMKFGFYFGVYPYPGDSDITKFNNQLAVISEGN